MREFSEVNQDYVKQGIEAYNAMPMVKELGLLVFALGPDLKEITLQLYMEQIEKVPSDKEGEIVTKAVELYNHLFDPTYVVPDGVFTPKEEVKVEEVKKPVAGEAKVEVEAPVKEKKERKPREPKAPKEPKEKVAREKKDLFAEPSAVTRILMIVCENPEISTAEIKAKLGEEGVKVSDGTVAIQSNDTRKTIAYLRKLGKLQ